MKEIKLTQGKVVLVDDADFEELSKSKWNLTRVRSICYASRSVFVEKKNKHTFMHRVIMGYPVGLNVDHIDGDGLNNQRANLRIVTTRENQCNTKRTRANPNSAGTTFNKKSRRYHARTRFKKGRIDIGTFKTQEDAHEAYVVFTDFIRIIELCEHL